MKLVGKSFMHLLLFGAILYAMTMHSGSANAQQVTSPTGQNDVTAIDILLDPDATMIQHAQAANARLLKNFPKGFTLGGAHAPHVTVLQRFVKTTDLPKVYAAADKVFAKENPTGWQLTAFKYDYIGDKTMAIGNILVKPTSDLLRLQRELIDAVTPFTAPSGTTAAFVTTPQDPDIVPELIPYVAEFVPAHSGDHYVPHVSIGVATPDFLNTMVAAPFEDFTFSPAGASIYHLGNYGTAMKKLHSIPLKH
jgi:2'-5' RNA ligase superfamily